MTKYILILVILVYSATSRAEETMDEVILWNTPNWIAKAFKNSNLDKKYRLSSKINPFYLRGDFNGDGKQDIAILIEELATKKIGIAIFHFNSNNTFIIGAGSEIKNGGSNFNWMDMWSVYEKQPIEQGVGEGEPPVINSEALHVGKSESASAIIYWAHRVIVWVKTEPEMQPAPVITDTKRR